MIASRLGMLIAWACAGVLAVVLWLDMRRAGGDVNRAIAPLLDPAHVTAIAWSGPHARRPHPVRIERDSASHWKWVDPVGDANREAVENLLVTLRGARWHRRAAASVAGSPSPSQTMTVTIESGPSAAISIALGNLLPGGEQQWIVVGDAALLVDTWVARALFPEPVALRIRQPFADAANARAIEIGSFVLQGTPRRITKLAGQPIGFYANAAVVDDLERALAEITTLAIPRAKVPIDTNVRGTRIALGDKLVAVEAGRCPDPNGDLHALVGPSIGPACVSEAAWTHLLAAAAVFDLRDDNRQHMLATLVEPRPVPLEVTSVILADGSTLGLAKRPQISEQGATRDADPARVAELLAVLATPAEPVALPATPAVGTVVIQGPRSDQPALHIVLYAGGVIARANEPIALRVGVGSFEILARGGRAYADPALWSEEPTTIRSIKIGDITYTRGVVIGEWTRDKPGPVDAAAVDKLAGLLAAPRSLAATTPVASARTVVLVIKGPIGEARTRTLTLGRGATCVATIDHTSHSIDPQLCALVDPLAR